MLWLAGAFGFDGVGRLHGADAFAGAWLQDHEVMRHHIGVLEDDFEGVISGCAGGDAKRPSTWINERIRKLYRDLFNQGFVHTVECYQDGALVGGLGAPRRVGLVRRLDRLAGLVGAGIRHLGDQRAGVGQQTRGDAFIKPVALEVACAVGDLHQLLGNGLELLRMFFFEAVLDSTTFPKPMQGFLRAWHILGSGLFWIFILASWTHFWLQKDSSGAERSIFLLCAGFIAYHAATMSQITNVVRYVFPILPFLYYFVADGISTALERVSAWRTKRKNRILAT